MGVFIYVRIMSLGDEHSRFNQTTRIQLGRFAVLRTLFGLHSAGDARAEYLKASGPISVEIVQAESLNLPQEVIDDFTSKVKEYTGRQTVLYNIDTVKRGSLSDADINDIIATNRRHVSPAETNLFVIYADDFNSKTDEVGRTVRDFGMVISSTRLQDLTRQSPKALNSYILSTMLHEFGHQLGLDHVGDDRCIMNKDIEASPEQSSFIVSYTPTSFCDKELEQLKGIKAALQ